MSTDGIKVTLDFNKQRFARLHVLTDEMSKRTAQGVGTIYVRYIAANTPPNAFRGGVKEALRNRKNKAVVDLQKRIAQNIAGVDSPKEVEAYARPVPYRKLSGAWLALEPEGNRPVKPRGALGMIVPISWRQVRKQAVPETEPEQVFAGAVWHKGGYKLRHYKRSFVRKNKLRKFVKTKQAHVGKLISGWARAARAFATGKSIATGFFENLGGKGFGRMYKNKRGNWCGFAINRQSYSEKQRAHLQAVANVSDKRTVVARKAQLEAIKRWYKKEAKRILG